ncbi:MAG: hypothetical protein H7Y38_00815, partial [Armatimonadetes bacterium]|nr:hypothetical protein [Armatimonadota bacterium]
DFAELRSLSAATGEPLDTVLQAFKSAGVHSVTLQEETVGGLNEEKRISFAPLGTMQTRLLAASSGDNTLFAAPSELPRVLSHVERKTRFGATASGETAIIVNAPWQYLRGVGIGLDPQDVAQVRGAGLGIVGRVGNFNGVSGDSLAWTLGELKRIGVSMVIFSGDEVLGYKGYIAPKTGDNAPAGSTVETLRSLKMLYGSVEFGKQKGDVELTKAAPDRVVRVHTITGGEMLTATVPDAVQRFSLAARERNMRLLFVRLFLDEPDPLVFNTQYIGKIVKALERGNLTAGAAHGYDALGVGFLPRLLIGLGIGAAFVLLADAVTRFLGGGLPPVWGALCFLTAIALIALAASPSPFGVKLAALAAALIFPSLGLLYHDLLHNEIWHKAGGRFAFACAVTAFGIVCVVGLLAGQAFLVKADAFVGIKATLAVPVLLVALVYALDLRARDDRTFREAWRSTANRLIALSRQPVLFWQIVAGAFALALVFVILSRSGNEGVGVSGVELKVRALLDRFLYARPRFKDLFGHAAMVFALLLYGRTGRRDWALPLFILGVFGQVSLLNTFCHLHTPLAVSLWRAALGIALGGAFGTIAFALVNRFVLRRLSVGAIEGHRSR